MTAPLPVLAAAHVTHRFGAVTALEDVSVDIWPGEITCLLGDNGAGKSTLSNLFSGVYAPTEGSILLDGASVRFASPRDALARGVATVYQNLALVPLLSVWRNFILGAEPTVGRGLLRRMDPARCREVALGQLAALGIPLADPEQPVATLSGGQRQAVAIARALHRRARCVILDEPTAALGVAQRALVLDVIRRVRAQGVGVLLVTHDPAIAESLADRTTVLERGRVKARRGP